VLFGERLTKIIGKPDPMSMSRMSGVAQGAVDQCNIVLTFSQNGNRNTLSPVQIAILAAATGTSIWTRIL